jgi:hypothetical protein
MHPCNDTIRTCIVFNNRGYPLTSPLIPSCFLRFSTDSKMHLTSVLSVSVFLLGTSSSTPIRSRSPYALKESHYVPRKWARVGAAPSEHILNLRIGLKQDRFDELEKALWEGNVVRPLSISKLTIRQFPILHMTDTASTYPHLKLMNL